MKKGMTKGPTICSICKRKKEVAIREQVEKCAGCGHNKCTFDKEIRAALQAGKKIKILPTLEKAYRIKIHPPLIPEEDEKQG